MISKLIVLLGPTAVGKTALSLKMAQELQCHIISADSRQIYRHLNIGTAKPSPQELATVPHHFIDLLEPDEYYSAAKYESDVMDLLATMQGTVIMVGGSMMYIDAVTRGIDDIPTIDAETRTMMKQKLEEEGIEHLCEELRLLDPEYYAIVDHKNTQRIVHALEICYMTGNTYTSFRKNTIKQRPFQIEKIGLYREREDLFSRINQRVEQMMSDGFLNEVKSLQQRYSGQQLPNSLNTVGYKEMLRVISGEWEFNMAKERMKKNTRVYAKKQMTWFKRDDTIRWIKL